MRIIFMGTPKPAAVVLETLLKARQEIILVVTQPDRPKGRGQKIVFSPVKELALARDLPLAQPAKAKDQVFISQARSLRPDLIIIVAYGQILPKELIAIPKFGCLNLHASLLPEYRGAAPIQWALINGDEKTGISIMRIDEGLDTGDIILQQEVIIAPEDNAISLTEKLFTAGAKLLLTAIKQIEQGRAKYTKQIEAGVSYAPLITKESGEIDWTKPADKIHNRIRALVEWPGAHTYWQGKLLRLFKSQTLNSKSEINPKPGTITKILKQKGFAVQTGAGELLILEVQLAGKKRMSTYDFALGQKLKAGDILPN